MRCLCLTLYLSLLLSATTAIPTLEASVRLSYQQAVDVFPALVADETPPAIFLQTEDFDPIKAATRLALYWKYRQQVFGERWLLPMNQTGAGALSAEDVEVLR